MLILYNKNTDRFYEVLLHHGSIRKLRTNPFIYEMDGEYKIIKYSFTEKVIPRKELDKSLPVGVIVPYLSDLYREIIKLDSN